MTITHYSVIPFLLSLVRGTLLCAILPMPTLVSINRPVYYLLFIGLQTWRDVFYSTILRISHHFFSFFYTKEKFSSCCNPRTDAYYAIANARRGLRTKNVHVMYNNNQHHLPCSSKFPIGNGRLFLCLIN